MVPQRNPLLQRMAAMVPIDCPHACGAQISRGDLPSHGRSCPTRRWSCTLCRFEGLRADLLQHLVTEHADRLLDRLDMLAQHHDAAAAPAPVGSGHRQRVESDASVHDAVAPLFGNAQDDY